MAEKRRSSGKPKILRARLALYAVLMLVGLAAAMEIVARLAVPHPPRYPIPHDRWRLELHTNLFHQWDDAEEIEMSRVNCDANEICSESYRVPRRKQPGRQRLICLGSSSTRGAGLRHWRQLYPAKLEEKLRAAGYEVEVLNAGCGGYNSYQLWIYLAEVLTLFEPDIVIFYYGGNETYGCSVKAYYPRVQRIVAELAARGVTDQAALAYAVQHGTADPRALRLSRMLDHSRAVAWLRQKVVGARLIRDRSQSADAALDGQPLTEPTLETILREMAALLRGSGAELLLCPEASTSDLREETADLKADLKESYSHRIMMRICAETTAVCVDAVADPPGLNSPAYFLDSTHLTEEGHERLAQTLLPVVRARLDARTPAH